MDTGTRAVCWLRPDQAALARAVQDQTRLAFAAAGAPDAAQRSAVAGELDAEPLDDLRATVASTEAGVIVLLDPGRFGASEEDRTALLEARARGVVVVSLEPIPAAALDLAGGWTASHNGVRAVDCVRPVPLVRQSASLRASAEVREQFGQPRVFSIECLCTPAEGSLGARLFDAMDLVNMLVGEPELVDASYAGPEAVGGLHALPGATLRDLRGELTAHLRFADGRSGTVLASSRSAGWERRITLLGEGGRLRLTEPVFVWHNPEGEQVDTYAADRAHAADPAASAIAHAVTNALDASAQAPVDYAAALAVAQAALLSARTGQSESPATIRRLIGTD